jgi:hypothetical protein
LNPGIAEGALIGLPLGVLLSLIAYMIATRNHRAVAIGSQAVRKRPLVQAPQPNGRLRVLAKSEAKEAEIEEARELERATRGLD